MRIASRRGRMRCDFHQARSLPGTRRPPARVRSHRLPEITFANEDDAVAMNRGVAVVAGLACKKLRCGQKRQHSRQRQPPTWMSHHVRLLCQELKFDWPLEPVEARQFTQLDAGSEE